MVAVLVPHPHEALLDEALTEILAATAARRLPLLSVAQWDALNQHATRLRGAITGERARREVRDAVA